MAWAAAGLESKWIQVQSSSADKEYPMLIEWNRQNSANRSSLSQGGYHPNKSSHMEKSILPASHACLILPAPREALDLLMAEGGNLRGGDFRAQYNSDSQGAFKSNLWRGSASLL